MVSPTANFFLAIENNSNTAAVATVHEMMREQMALHCHDGVVKRVYLYHAEAQYIAPPHPDSLPGTPASVRYRRTETQLPGYCMTYKKKDIINVVLQECNRGNFAIAHTLVCDRKIAGVGALTYLIKQTKLFAYVPERRTYTGKRNKTTSDDVMIAVIMSIYLALQYSERTADFVGKDRLPWRLLIST